MKILKWKSEVPKTIVGKRVIMTAQGIRAYGLQSRGSVGTVVRGSETTGWAKVRWDAGERNNYKSGDLALASKKAIEESAKIAEKAKKDAEAKRLERKAEVLEWAEKAQITLKKAVHSKGCKNIDQCPRQHEKCRDHLDFQTAMMWELALLIEDSARCYKEDKQNPDDYKGGMKHIRLAMRQHSDKITQNVYDILECNEWFRLIKGFQKE